MVFYIWCLWSCFVGYFVDVVFYFAEGLVVVWLFG